MQTLQARVSLKAFGIRREIAGGKFRKVMEQINDRNVEVRNGTSKNGKNSLEAEFKPPYADVKQKKTIKETQSISYFKLFKYAAGAELLLLFIGVTFGILSGVFLPLIIMIYGEYTTLLVDRSTFNKTISPTKLLPLFNGGRETDGTDEDRIKAIKEDAAAFGIEFGILAVLQFVISFLTVATLNYAAVLQTSKLRRAFLKSVLRQEISWYDCNNVNSFASSMIENLNRVQEGIGEKIGIFINLAMSFIMSVTMAFFYGWKLTLVMLSCAPVLIASNALVSKVQMGLTTKEMEAYGKAGSVAEEVLSSIKTVMAFSGQQKELKRYNKELEHSLKTGIRRGLLSGLGSGLMWFITYSCYALAFWYGVSLILESREANNFEYTPAVLIIIFFGVLAGAINLGQSSPHLEAFSLARGAAASVFSILERTSEIDPLSTKGKVLQQVKGEIQFKNVHFEYPARSEVQVLKGFNLKIKKGELVALVGASGCGKSTVVQLIQRFYDPSSGSIQIDGENISELNVKFLRQQFGVVGQEPSLFGTTIYENIGCGLESATKEEIEEAAKQANAHDFIMKLPNGYQTVLGAKGSLISGGQKQRIAIARALIRNPKILLLDEATSALDADSERKVQEALDRAAKSRTTLVVTHKLSAITKADRIVVISEGKVVEEGNHQELISRKSHYFRLLEMQKNNEENFLKEKKSEKIENSQKTLSSIPRISVTSTKGFLPEEEMDENLESEQPSPASMKRIMKYNRPEWWAIFVGALSTLVVGGSSPVLAILFGELYGVLSDTNPDVVSESTAYYSGLLLALGIASGIGNFLQLYLFNYSGVKLTFRIRKLVFGAILNQEAGWFDDEKHKTGVLCARLSSSAADIQGATGSRISVLIQSVSTILLGVILGFFYSWKMTLVTLISAPVIFCGLYFEGKVIQGQSLLEKKAIEGATKISMDAICNIRTVASLGREQIFLDHYDKELQAGEKGMKYKSKIRGAIYGLGTSSPYFGYALALWYGGILVADGELHYKNVIKVSEALLFGMWILGQSLAFAPNFSQAKISAARLFQILDRIPKLQNGRTEKEENWRASGKVELSNVEFAYPTRSEVKVLKDLCLKIDKGHSIALVGPSGCGKSTVIHLLQRLYDPTEGNIYLDENEISSLKIATLRSQFGVVSQEPVLFDTTIAENIAYGDNSRTVPEAEILSAAKSANIHDFVISLPLGYETRVGAGGTQLSGGQKQRIAIARALVRNPRILLLDEATSALDAENESVVQAALDSASAGRTTITVGHRLGAIKRADMIYRLEKGQIRETGSYDQLFTNENVDSENL